jgi:hypothetical protein
MAIFFLTGWLVGDIFKAQARQIGTLNNNHTQN